MLLVAICGLLAVLAYADAASISKTFNLSPAIQQFVVDLHNNYRSTVAKGQVGSQPTAADMLKMSWDSSLAAYAQSNTNKCDFQHSATVVNGQDVGENMAAGTLNSPISTDADLQKYLSVQFKNSTFAGVDTWVDEQSHFSYPDCIDGEVCGHWTQVVWGPSNKVGCGITQCNGLTGNWQLPSSQLAYLILCNYSPAGNMQTFADDGSLIMPPPYTSGATCSSCPAPATCSSTTGLCA
jgi:hypothetical protein